MEEGGLWISSIRQNFRKFKHTRTPIRKQQQKKEKTSLTVNFWLNYNAPPF